MKSLWNDTEAAQFPGDLGLRVYSSRLLGRDKSLVLHGGGNTSVKIAEKNLLGEEEALLYVKGSGWDLEIIEAAGFSPVRMEHLLRLAKLPQLSDPQMVNELRTHMTRASAPTPSVEAILHAILPYKYVDHTHADAVITVTNTAKGQERIREIYGDSVVVIPYVMPGFDLARLCAEEFRQAGRQEYHRHGADEPRHLFLRRNRAGILRTHDRTRDARRGLSRETQGLAVAGRYGKAVPRPAARRSWPRCGARCPKPPDFP